MRHFASSNEELNLRACNLHITVMQGDDVDFLVDVVSVHERLEVVAVFAPGSDSDIELPVDVINLSFDSSIQDGTGKEIAKFQITDDPQEPNRVRIYLSGVETQQMTPGTYSYWVEWVNADTGTRRTPIRAPFEVLRK